ncbi:hypothetical protein [Halostella litorea]|uniref:hypothetical protein n=1 Tax=Halostella litorea TaxID=2528831 RepID=UPI00109211EE|nr:hypothetical protein [Halostella litorea]
MSTDHSTTTDSSIAPQDREHVNARVPSEPFDAPEIALAPDEQTGYLVELHHFRTPLGEAEFEAVYATVTGNWAVRRSVGPDDQLPSRIAIERGSGIRVPWSLSQTYHERIGQYHLNGGDEA